MTAKCSTRLFGLAGAFFAASILVGDVSAQASETKLSFEQAWAKCKQMLDSEKVPGTLTSNDRYLRGGACMAKFGYSL